MRGGSGGPGPLLLRRVLLAASRRERVKHLITSVPVTADLVARYVAGDTVEDALSAARRLVADGLLVSVDHLGEDTSDENRADAATAAYVDLLRRLSEAGLTGSCEVSVKLSALGLRLGRDGPLRARDNAELVCAAARDAGTTVTVDMEDDTLTEATVKIVTALRRTFPDTGAVLQAYLRRTEGDCRDLAYAGSRVRLCKGAYDAPEAVAFSSPAEVDRSYVRCLRTLFESAAYPMVATHDPRLIEVAGALAERNGRAPDSYEFQMLYGIRPSEQHRLVADGRRVRVYLPYGVDWYGYLVRRLAERPANVALFARSLVSRR